jgi:hypothetical protein
MLEGKFCGKRRMEVFGLDIGGSGIKGAPVEA